METILEMVERQATEQCEADHDASAPCGIHMERAWADVGRDLLPVQLSSAEAERRLGLCPDCLFFEHEHDYNCVNEEAQP